MTKCAPRNSHNIPYGLYWLKSRNGYKNVFQWCNSSWQSIGSMYSKTPEEMGDAGYTVMCECKEPVE